MDLLLDTHILIWWSLDDPRLTSAQKQAMFDPANVMHVSAVVGYEFTQLQQTHRVPVRESLATIQAEVGFDLLDLPAECWRKIDGLPDIHRDPIDRMLIAHALVEGFTLITADLNIRRYEVPFI